MLLYAIIALVVVAVVVGVLLSRKAPALPAEPEAPKPLPQKPQDPSKPPRVEAPKPTPKPEPTAAPEPAKPVAAQPEQPVTKPVEAPVAPAEPTTDAPVAPSEPSSAPPELRPSVFGDEPRKTYAPVSRRTDVAGLRKGLARAREKEGFFGRLRALFTGAREIDPNVLEHVEEILLTSDVGVTTTELLLADVRRDVKEAGSRDTDFVWQALRDRATALLNQGEGGLRLSASPTVVMVVGVNGVGKTTTIGKLATKLRSEGKKVVLAAGDTFRAAAVQQLAVWGKRVGCEVVSGKDGTNPGAVLFDAIQRAKEIGADVVLADTAGRLHTKTNLMEELGKVARTVAKAMEGAPHETLLVLDATNGQNAMQQAAMFKESLPISGIVLTKLDGTAKGGVILGICAEHKLPVRYVGIGERAEDLREFSPESFVEALLGTGEFDA